MNITNSIYKSLLHTVRETGELISTRNHEVKRSFLLPNTTFTETPLVTIRKTAWKKAIKEQEWFLSGQPKCPEELLDWWEPQLNTEGCLLDGYSVQFRHSIYSYGSFDQLKFILDGLKNNPNSRRLLISLWNPGDMAEITETNRNPNTPTCCHSILIQFFVSQGKLHMKTYQRSADMLLGVPHNWIQSWAFLLYLAYHSGLGVGSLTWMWGDSHIYQEESHFRISNEIIEEEESVRHNNPQLVYRPTNIQYDWNNVPIFKAEDFFMEGVIDKPVVIGRPKLL